jgi:hypothetical protein
MTRKQGATVLALDATVAQRAANANALSASDHELLAIPKADWAIAKHQERIVCVVRCRRTLSIKLTTI